MRINPCPCMSLQRSTKFLAIIDLGFSLIGVNLFAIGLVRLLATDEYDAETEKNLTIIFACIGICVAILQAISARHLYNGAINEDIKKCRKWLIVAVVTAIAFVICVVTRMALDTFSLTDTIVISVFTVFKVYEFVVVYEFLVTSTATESNYVSPYIIRADVPPSYIETQNQPESINVDLPPPQYEQVISSQKDNIV